MRQYHDSVKSFNLKYSNLSFIWNQLRFRVFEIRDNAVLLLLIRLGFIKPRSSLAVKNQYVIMFNLIYHGLF